MFVYYTIFPWQLSDLFLLWTSNGLAALEFVNQQSEPSLIQKYQARCAKPMAKNPEIFAPVVSALNRYLSGQPVTFDLALDLGAGTRFQRQVWDQVRKIPYGQTRTYLQIAHSLGNSNSARAVGHANASNPIPIIIPCHRVVQVNGALGGYSGGIAIKDFLLRMEGGII